MFLRRCILFFPAHRPDRFEKAVASGADAVCIDLEDAVAPHAKDEGRAAAMALLERIAAERMSARQDGGASEPPDRSAPVSRASGRPEGRTGAERRVEVILRINDPESETGGSDLAALLKCRGRPDALMMPKVREADDVARVVAGLAAGGSEALPLMPLIETVRGLASAEAVAGASPCVAALLFGGVDLSAELGCAMEWDALLYARSRVVHAAALAGIDAIDMPFLDVPDTEGLDRESRAAARLGFRGKIAIHPTQVPVIQAAFSPVATEIERARRIVEAYECHGGGVFLVDGKMVERPVILAAQRTLAIAEAMGASGPPASATGSGSP